MKMQSICSGDQNVVSPKIPKTAIFLIYLDLQSLLFSPNSGLNFPRNVSTGLFTAVEEYLIQKKKLLPALDQNYDSLKVLKYAITFDCFRESKLFLDKYRPNFVHQGLNWIVSTSIRFLNWKIMYCVLCIGIFIVRNLWIFSFWVTSFFKIIFPH